MTSFLIHQALKNLSGNDCVQLDRNEMHHLKVLRVRKGEVLRILDGCGGVGEAVFDGKHLILKNIHFVAPLKPDLRLCMAVLDSNRFEWIVEKATEWGVTSIQPFLSERTEARVRKRFESRLDRLVRISKEALKQSGSSFLPQLLSPLSLAEALDESAQRTLVVAIEPSSKGVFEDWEKGAAHQEPISLWVGPEGGWGELDFKLFASRNTKSILYPHATLRAETAALSFVSIIRYHYK